jgi:hypothetical protein
MLNRHVAALLAVGIFGMVAAAEGADQEGCLFCHRLELAHAGSGNADLRVTERQNGLHAGLYCSDCHPDGRMAPHSVAPGAARCIEECHGSGAGAVPENHRRAAFGGLTETHRQAAAPSSPCLFCHKADDPPSSASPAADRCRDCHRGQALSVSQGVHARSIGGSARIGCTACHPPHPAATAGGRPGKGTTCAGTGCHAVVTERMKALGSHGKGDAAERPGRASGLILFGAIAALGLLPGRLLCRNRPAAKGEAR